MSIADKLTTVAENQEKVFEAGRTKEWNDFWDIFQNYGNRKNYSDAFLCNANTDGTDWPKLFKPKYDMKPTTASGMFQYFGRYSNSGTKIDLETFLENRNIVMDFSKVTYANECFEFASGITALPEIDLSSVPSYSGRLNYFFSNANSIKSIRKLIIPNAIAGNSMFHNMSSLEDIVIEGTLKGNDISLSSSTKLTHDSLMSFINALMDYSGTTTTYKITLGSKNIEKLTADELKIIEDKGWTYA